MHVYGTYAENLKNIVFQVIDEYLNGMEFFTRKR